MWVHFTAEKSKLLESQGLVVKNTGFHYSDHDGIFVVEYHADNFIPHQIFQWEAIVACKRKMTSKLL